MRRPSPDSRRLGPVTAEPEPCASVPPSSAPAPRAVPVLRADLGPWAQVRAPRLGRRTVQLVVGLLLHGFSLGMIVVGALGMAPWDVLHAGVANWVPLSLGQVVVVTSFLLLLVWIPLRERPGLGTVLNALLVGLGMDATIALLPDVEHVATRVALVIGGVVLNGFATALYIGAQLGRGPRDGLMTGLSRVTGWSLRAVRTALEVSAVGVGLVLGGVLGLGTVLYALAIGPVAQAFLPYVTVELPEPDVGEKVSDASR